MLFALAMLGFLELTSVWHTDLAPEVRQRVSAVSYRVINDTVTQVVDRKQLFWLTGGFVLALLCGIALLLAFTIQILQAPSR